MDENVGVLELWTASPCEQGGIKCSISVEERNILVVEYGLLSFVIQHSLN